VPGIIGVLLSGEGGRGEGPPCLKPCKYINDFNALQSLFNYLI